MSKTQITGNFLRTSLKNERCISAKVKEVLLSQLNLRRDIQFLRVHRIYTGGQLFGKIYKKVGTAIHITQGETITEAGSFARTTVYRGRVEERIIITYRS